MLAQIVKGIIILPILKEINDNLINRSFNFLVHKPERRDRKVILLVKMFIDFFY